MKSPPQFLHRFLSSSTASTSSSLQPTLPNPIATRCTIQNLIKSGATPSITHLNLYLYFLLRSRRFNLCLSFFSQIKSPHPKSNAIVAEALLKSCGASKDAESFMSCAGKFGIKPGDGILNSLVYKVCILEKDPYWAFRLLQEFARNYELLPSQNTLYNLISAFCSRREMDSAMQVFEVMSARKRKLSNMNHICSMLISGFAKNGQPELGIRFFERVKRLSGFSPNLVTYTALVDALCKDGRIEEASNLISDLEEKGIVLDRVLYSSLISGYFRKGLLMDGLLKHCEMMKKGLSPDVVNYTNIIEGFCKEGGVQKVIGLLNEMMSRKITLNLVTLTVLIGGFCKRSRFKEALQVFNKIEELGIASDKFSETILVDGMCKSGQLNMAFGFIREIENRGMKQGIVTYNVLINGLCKAGRTDEACRVAQGIAADKFTYTTLLRGFLKLRDEKGILELKKRLEKSNISMDIVMCNMLIKALFAIGQVCDARNLFDEMHDRKLVADSVTYYAMIDGYCKNGETNKALDLFTLYRKTSLHFNNVCSDLMIRGLIEAQVNDAYTILDKGNRNFNSTNLSNFSLVIDGLCKAGSIEKALDFCETMRKRGISPNVESYNSILNGLCNQGCLGEAFQILDALQRSNVQLTVLTYTPIIGALCKEGLLKDACAVFDKMLNQGITPDTCVSNMLIYGYCNLCFIEDAIKFLSSMYEKYSIQPDEFTISALIKGISLKGDIDGAFGIFSEYKGKGIFPTFFGFMHLVNGFYSRGRLEEARGVIREMLSHARIEILVNKFGGEIYDEPLVSILLNACEQGRIREVMSILSEVSYMFNSNLKNSEGLIELQDSYLNNSENLLGKSLYDDFDSYYPAVATLCIKGEIKEASDVINAMILNSG